MDGAKHLAAQASPFLQFVRNQRSFWQALPGLLRFMEKMNGFGCSSEIENGRPARKENLVGAEHDGPRRFGKSCGSVDDDVIRVSRELCDSTNYLFRGVEGFKLDRD